MKEVEVSQTFEAPKDEIEAVLSPEAIVDFEGTFDVESREERGDETVLILGSRTEERSIQAEILVQETRSGYRYRQGDFGVFERLETEIDISIEENVGTTVVHRSRYTFGGRLAFLKNWLAADLREEEAERFMMNLARELV